MVPKGFEPLKFDCILKIVDSYTYLAVLHVPTEHLDFELTAKFVAHGACRVLELLRAKYK